MIYLFCMALMLDIFFVYLIIASTRKTDSHGLFCPCEICQHWRNPPP